MPLNIVIVCLPNECLSACVIFFFQAEDGIRDGHVTGVQTCALPISADEAAATILKGVIKNKRRVLIGNDAKAIDALQRLLPTSYQRIVVSGQRALRRYA